MNKNKEQERVLYSTGVDTYSIKLTVMELQQMQNFTTTSQTKTSPSQVYTLLLWPALESQRLDNTNKLKPHGRTAVTPHQIHGLSHYNGTKIHLSIDFGQEPVKG